ncbi:MAG: DnaD domain protein [Bacillota bacterium]
MAWIELHQSLPSHRKTLIAAELLNIPPVHFVGHITTFWLWCLDNVPDGILAGISPRMIARAAQWEGDPDQFFSALVQAGFVDIDQAEVPEIHDWHDYAGRLVERRRADAERKRAERKRKERGQKQDVRRMSDGCPTDVPQDSSRMSCVTKPNLTKHDHDHVKDHDAKVVHACEAFLGRLISQRDIEMINNWDYPLEIIQEAMRRAAAKGGKSLRYVDTILVSWAAKGWTTLAQIRRNDPPGKSRARAPDNVNADEERSGPYVPGPEETRQLINELLGGDAGG